MPMFGSPRAITFPSLQNANLCQVSLYWEDKCRVQFLRKSLFYITLFVTLLSIVVKTVNAPPKRDHAHSVSKPKLDPPTTIWPTPR
ncbi:unnamed protein product [Protopolystoma xenopodis]|uniref:Transmembrane protein n=1 Tax=Protopolystoma xenopodis TaxID=117903 RepID=A0A3S5CT10_9PLAT|nr:unnamed protein product [Protopolystoma xenopodis]